MSKRISLLFSFCFLAALWTIPAMAQFGAVEGDVKDVDGKPGTGMQIVIDREDMKGHWDMIIKDKKGHYYHGGLPIGKYTIIVRKDGKDMDSVKGVKVGLGDPLKMDFDLKQVAMRQQAAQAGIALPPANPGGGAQEQKLSKEQIAKIQEEQNKREEARKKQNQLQSSFNAGREALAAKNCEEAVNQFNIAAQNDPTQVAVFGNLADAYNCLAKQKSGDEKKEALAKSEEAYTKAIALKPDDGALHHNMGLVMVNAGKVQEGIAELTKATQLDPPNAGKYFFNLGAVLTNLGKGDEAAVAFQSATKADPNYAEAYYQYATALLAKASLDVKTNKMVPAPGTVEGFQKYLELAPEGPNAKNAKDMIEALGSTVQTEIKGSKQAPAKKKP